jgi:hypothetical protein
MSMPRVRDGSLADYARQRWEDRYHDVLAGVAPDGFDVAEWRAILEEQGRLHGYLEPEQLPPGQGAMNARIRDEVSRAAREDIEAAQRRVTAAPEG